MCCLGWSPSGITASSPFDEKANEDLAARVAVKSKPRESQALGVTLLTSRKGGTELSKITKTLRHTSIAPRVHASIALGYKWH